MKKDDIKFYKLGEKKSIIKISDSKDKKRSSVKAIIIHSTVISILFIFMFVGFGIYSTGKINKIAALLYNSTNDIEKMNDSSNNLLVANVNYNEKYEVLINKANPINEDIANLYNQVEVKNNLYSGIRIEETTYKNYLKLKDVILSKGYYLNIRSGFRTYEESISIYNSYANKYGNSYAEKYVAKPGTSEHNTGLAFDVIVSTNENAISNNYQSDEYKYLENIAYLYGFIIRYPKGKEQITGYEYEPWHLRYVGKTLAKYLTKNNLTLEEYYEEKE